MSKSKGNVVAPVGGHRPLRRRRAALVLLHLQAAVGRLPASRPRRSARACGCSCASCGTRTRSRRSTSRDARRAPARETDLDRWIRSRLSATVETVTERLDAYDATTARPRDRRVRRRPLQLVRAPLAAALLGGRRAPRSTTLRHCLVTVVAAARAVHAVRRRRDLRQPRRLASRASTSPTGRSAGERDVELEAAMAIARETVRLGLAARGAAKIKVRQPLHEAVVVAAGARARRRSSASPTSCARSSTSRRCASSREADELGSYTLKPNYRTLGPALRQGDAAGRRGGRGARRRRTSPTRCARAGRSASSSTATTTRSAADDLQLAHGAAGGLPARARGLARGRAGARARRRAAPRGPRARGRPRRPERAPRAPAWRSPTASSWRSAATRSCSPPRARTSATSPARCSPSPCATTPTARRRSRASRAASCGSPSPARR